MRFTNRPTTTSLAAACVFICAACSCSKDEPATAKISDVDQAKVKDRLAAWDSLDGETDKTIQKCAGCALSMDGKTDHALTVSGFSMRFCSDHCRDNFAENTAKKILALKSPNP